ncbi:AAA family ATPase [Rhodococcoides fascians]|uniref:AAA family ATPase n=1 Tax=Rhodococcoides fascians TaxID=1828 RepID=UPI0015C66399|nr:AAA family ATPase [Rhodococcus fascians]
MSDYDPRVFTWLSGSEVTPVRVDWWEHHLIPRGCLTVPAGRGNAGKSTACAAWAAEATRSGEVVAWLHSEEDRAMHITPKMLAAGADLDLIKFLDVGVQMEDGTISEATLQLPRDIARLEEGLVALGCRFVVFDALTSFKSSKMSANSGDDVRAFLEPIQRMAGRLNAVVLGIAHLGKDGERKARDAVKGASEWTDVPRQVLAFHREDGETEGVISDVKGNLSPSPRSIGYAFENISLPEHGIEEVGRITFTGDVDINVDEARRSAAPDDDSDDRKESEVWLEDYLTENGQVDSTIAKRDGSKALGVSTKTISRAASAIKVKMTPRGFPRKTFWSLATIIDGEFISGDSGDMSDPPVTHTVSSLVPTGDDQAKHNVPTGVPTEENPSEDIGQNSVTTAPDDRSEPPEPTRWRVSGEVVEAPPRLHVVADADKRVTALQWVTDHVMELIDAGTTTVESSTVYSAGEAAGFRIDNLRQAVKKCELIGVAARKGSGTVWSLGTGGANTIVSAEAWLTEWLRSTGDSWVKAADVYAAGLQAGYGRDAVKAASRAPHIRKRGQSISTEWSVAS